MDYNLQTGVRCYNVHVQLNNQHSKSVSSYH